MSFLKKGLASVGLAAVLAVGLTACGGEAPDTSSADSSSADSSSQSQSTASLSASGIKAEVNRVTAGSYDNLSDEEWFNTLKEGLSADSNSQTLSTIKGFYEFELDGQKFSLPAKLSDFENAGWELRADNTVGGYGELNREATVDGSTIARGLVAVKGDNVVALQVVNFSENERPVMDCTVCGVEVTSEEFAGNFSTSMGLSLGEDAMHALDYYGGARSGIGNFDDASEKRTVEWKFYQSLPDEDKPEQSATKILTSYAGTDEFEITFDVNTREVTKISMFYLYDL